MPDTAVETSSADTAKPAAVVETVPNHGAMKHDALRRGILEKFAAGTLDTDLKTEAKPETKAEPKKTVPKPEAGESKPEATEETASDVANDNQDDGSDKTEPEHDRDTAKRLGVVAKAEKRAKEALRVERAQIAEERATFEAARKEHQARTTSLEQLIKSAKQDPWGLLVHLGATEDDAEHIAQSIYLNSKAGAADPARKQAVAAAKAKREELTRVEQLEKKIADMEEAATSREQQSRSDKAVNTYLDAVTKAVGEEHPLTRAVLAKNPTKVRNALATIALELSQEYDETPDAEDVLAAYEKQRAAELDELGIDPATVRSASKASAEVSNDNKATGKTNKTVSGLGSTTAVQKKPGTLAEKKAQAIANLIAGKTS